VHDDRESEQMTPSATPSSAIGHCPLLSRTTN
jgi:hypothetical protein